MAELQFPNIVGQYNQGFDRGQSLLADKLAGQAFSATGDQRQSLLGQLAGVNPQAAMGMQSRFQQQDQAQQAQARAQEVDHAKKLNGAANFMLQAVATKDPARIQGAWQSVRPYLAELSGKTPPDQFDPAMLPKMYEIVGQTGGMPDERGVVLSAGGQLRNPMTGELIANNPQSLQYHDVPMGAGTAAGVFDPATGTVRPAVGGAAQPGPQGAPQGDPMQPFIEQANHAVQLGADPAKVEAWLQQQAASMGGQPIAPADQSAQGQAQAMQAPSQFGVGAPKASSEPDSFRAATPGELKMLGLPEGSVAQINTKTGKFDVISKPAALSPDKLADVAVKRQKVEQAKQESVATFNDSINKIDGLLADPSFSSLGTFTGDIAAKIPHTDTANARSMLDTISAQSVINVLSSLKSLSANGASGFGALSEKEGEILRNAAANLSTSQSNAAIKQNLLDLKKKLERSRDLVATQQIKLPEDSVGQQASASAPQAAAQRPRAVNSMGHAVVWNGSAWVPE